ncbi:CheR family methyltransferase [Acidimangrovimonas sediminis]|uniref:CheR family methyltransferase n=1 Tax=Acidimangrovimonas sediminis TaxID=2056283 RepID=UPI000C803398|nr:protein-glutamate O-methyltransferase [Acidimangrovimonas sediminis]
MIHAPPSGGEPGPLAREYAYTPEDFGHIAALCHARAGIVLPPAKQDHVYSRLSRRLRALGLSTFSEYLRRLDGPEGVEEQRQMISALTTNVTRFFREPHHFEHFSTQVLPDLVARARAGGRVRLWSAGCASGEEPYSLAFTVLRALPEAARCDLRILASDIDPEVLASAGKGQYSGEASAQMPAWVDAKMAVRGPDGMRIGDAARRIVDFRPLNLIRPFPMRGPFDAIFCRNVTIYFDAETQQKVWTSFMGVMRPGSHLYIGHSERLPPALAAQFTATCTTGYRMADETQDPADAERRKTWR